MKRKWDVEGEKDKGKPQGHVCGRIEKIMWQGKPNMHGKVWAIASVRNSTWKGDFPALHPHLFQYELFGTLDSSQQPWKNKSRKPFVRDTYLMDKESGALSYSVAMTSENIVFLFTELFKACFVEENHDDWKQEDVDAAKMAVQQLKQEQLDRFRIPKPTARHRRCPPSRSCDYCTHLFSHKKPSTTCDYCAQQEDDTHMFDLMAWFETQKDEHWVKVIREHPIGATYVVCLYAAKLLRYYDAKPIAQLSNQQLTWLIQQVDTDIYPLFFRNVYGGDESAMDSLPECSIHKINMMEHPKLTPHRLAVIWLYKSLQGNEANSGDTVVPIKQQGKRTFIKFAASRRQDFQSIRKIFEKKLGERHAVATDKGKNESNTKRSNWVLKTKMPDYQTGDFAPLLKDLLDQKSVVMLDKPKRIQLMTTYRSNQAVAQFLYCFDNDLPTEPKEKETTKTDETAVPKEGIPEGKDEKMAKEKEEETKDDDIPPSYSLVALPVAVGKVPPRIAAVVTKPKTPPPSYDDATQEPDPDPHVHVAMDDSKESKETKDSYQFSGIL